MHWGCLIKSLLIIPNVFILKQLLWDFLSNKSLIPLRHLGTPNSNKAKAASARFLKKIMPGAGRHNDKLDERRI